jgi:radical SAM-linked protein
MKFTKTGPLKFIGHLDVMRYFQKAFRRAELDVEYSQGYSPHQLMSFAAPLGVGLTSDGEYLDVQLHTSDTQEVMIKRINEVMAEDIQVVGYRMLPDDSKNAMSVVAAADYLVSLKDGYEFMDKLSFEQKFNAFMKEDNILIVKKTKKSENEVDIRPSIYHVAFDKEEFNEAISKECSKDNMIETVAEIYHNGIKVYMQLATGSVNNLKPELVMEAFCKYCQIEFNEFAFQVHRLEVYGDAGDENQRELVALEKL